MAQILYVYGITEQPDVVAVDRALGRKPGEIASEQKAHLFLLGEGFFSRTYSQNDDEAFLAHGLGYIRRYFGRKWGPQHAAYYTPGKIRELQDGLRQYLADLRPYAHRVETVDRWATKADIRQMLTFGRVVDIPVRSSSGPTQHAALLVPYSGRPDASVVWIYSPAKAEQDGRVVTAASTRFRDAVSRLMPGRSVTAYWR